jgi:hypothetical protein
MCSNTAGIVMARRLLWAADMKNVGLIVAVLGVLSVPAMADRPNKKKSVAAKTKKASALPVIRYGESFDLSRSARKAAKPVDEDIMEIEYRTVSVSQVGQVVKDRAADLEYCWLRLPPGQRKHETTAILRLSIHPSGSVAATELVGDVPPACTKCLVAQTSKWTFPEADTLSTVDYPITLK